MSGAENEGRLRVLERTITIKYHIPFTDDTDLNADSFAAFLDFIASTPKSKYAERMEVVTRELSEEETKPLTLTLLGDVLSAVAELNLM